MLVFKIDKKSNTYTQLLGDVITLLHISNKNRYVPKPCIVTRFC